MREARTAHMFEARLLIGRAGGTTFEDINAPVPSERTCCALVG